MDKQQRKELEAEARIVNGPPPVSRPRHPLSPDTRGLSDEERRTAYLGVRSRSYRDMQAIMPGRIGFSEDGRDWLKIIQTATIGVYGFARATHKEWMDREPYRRITG